MPPLMVRTCFLPEHFKTLPHFCVLLLSAPKGLPDSFPYQMVPGDVITANVDEEQSTDRLNFCHMRVEYTSALSICWFYARIARLSIYDAISYIVGVSKNVRIGTSLFKAALTLEIIRVASIESPPSSRKVS